MIVPPKLQSARLKLLKSHPYLGSAVWALVPVERPGLGTLAVDQWWRLYYDPAVLEQWSTEEVAGVLYHEICHLLRGHHERLRRWDKRIANIAGDLEINDDLVGEGVKLPNPLLPDRLGLPRGKFAEEYAEALNEKQQAEPEQSQRPQQSVPAPGQGQVDSDEDAQEGASSGSARPQPGMAEGQGDEAPEGGAQEAPSGGTREAPLGGAQEAPPGGAGDSEPAPSTSSGAPSTPSRVPSMPSETPSTPSRVPSPPPSPGVGSGVGAGNRAGAAGPVPSEGRERGPAVEATDRPSAACGRCGSCAHGQREPWEEGPPGISPIPGISPEEAEIIRRRVAHEIIRIAQESQNRGVVPGHWRRWAEERLTPKVDWRRELASAIRRAVASKSGAVDYTYRRPSRRSQAIPNVILPSLHQPVPEVAVVIDTSGSMSDRMVAQGIAEAGGVIKATQIPVRVLSVDATVHVVQKVFKPEQIIPVGGGGTDMRVGIVAAMQLKPRPSVIVVITDGHTPWPDYPPPDTEVIVVLVGSGSGPKWGKTVCVEV